MSEKKNLFSYAHVVFLLIVPAFAIQTVLVYGDGTPEERSGGFSRKAVRGLKIWRENNCQACHQLYGFGGFLGPDLTNFMAERPDENLEGILTEGRKQMPSYYFSYKDRDAIAQFLLEMNETGISQPRFALVKPDLSLTTMATEYQKSTGVEIPEAVFRGQALFKENSCATCHWPFRRGANGGQDLTATNRSPEFIRHLLQNGNGTMPRFGFLTEDNIADLTAFIKWLRKNRRELGLMFSSNEFDSIFNWSDVPWFEY